MSIGSQPQSMNLVIMMRNSSCKAYPFLPAGGDHHEALWSRQVWAPRLWGADTRLDLTDFERRLAVELLPLPVDHRYGPAEMDRLVMLVREATA